MTTGDTRSDRLSTPVRRATGHGPPPWLERLPSGALVLAFGIKAALAPNAVRDVFSGSQAFLVAFAILAGWVLLWLVVLPRFVRNSWVRVVTLGVVAGLIIWWLVVSALVDEKVVETLPGAPAAASGAKTDRDTPPSTTAAAPELLGTAKLRGIDHDATGTVALYQRPDGSLIVGLEEIDIEPGPDYKLYVVPGIEGESPGTDGVFLESLRGNQGTQYYDIPAGTNFELGEWSVLVWCRAFAVPIAAGTPA